MSKPRALLLAMIDMPAEDEEEFNRWCDEDDVPQRLACPGFVSCRRFTAVQGEPKYLTIYELDGPEALETPEYKALGADVSEQSKRVASRWTKLIRNVYVEIPTPDSPVIAADSEL